MVLVKSVEIDIGVKGDAASKAKLDAIDARAEELKRTFPEFELKIDSAAATEKLAVFKAELRDVARTHTATLKVDVDRSSLSRLRSVLGGLLGGGGGGAGGAGGAAGGLGTLGPWGIGALAATGAALAPGLLGLGIGGGVGLLGVGGALLAGNYAQGQVTKSQNALLAQMSAAAQVTALQRQIAAARTPAQLAAVPGLQQRLGIAQMRSQNAAAAYGQMPSVAQARALAAPFTSFGNTFQDLGNTAMMTFARSVVPLLKPVAGIFADMGRQIRLLQPLMQAMFTASLPFIRMFSSLIMQAGKILMPALTQAMNDMVKSGALPLMAQGFTALIKGLAGFITALGPGMKSSAMLFNDLAVIIGHVMRGAGLAVSWFANVLEDYFHRARNNMHQWAVVFDDFRHRTAVIFDGARHDIAHIWDMIFQNTIGRVSRGITDVTAWFKRLPGLVLDALKSLGPDLLGVGKWAIGQLWAGIKAAAGSITGGGILGWLAGFAHGVVGVFKKIWGWFSPSSVMYEGGKSLMTGLAAGIKDHAHLAMNQISAIGAGAVRGGLGGGVQRWAGLAAQALRMEGLSPGLLRNVLYQMQTESGGNPAAINLTDINAQMGDPSRGLMQVIGSTFARFHWPGTSWNIYDPLANIAAALNYARWSYGPTLMNAEGGGIGSGHGYAFGTSAAAPGWAWVGERGPELMRFRGGEQVYPAGRGGGDTYVIHIHAPSGNAADIGRTLAGYLRQHEKRSGKGWRTP